MTTTPEARDPASFAADVARLVIPTTNGPVDVVYLARDPALDTSIVCINGTASQAGMSAAYGAFVRRGTGVIERYFGPGHFRLDLSERIDVGDSWKLGIYLAHALQTVDRLSLPLDANADVGSPSMLVWATGAVRSVDLAVGEVANVAEKLRFSLPLFEAARAQGLRCLAVVPRGNADDGDPATMARLRALGVEFMAVRQIDEALRALGLPLPARAASAEPAEGPQWKGNPFRGLEPFTPQHRRIFFGRARAREEVVERLITAAEMGRAFVLIHGRSGSGKSSLALAGIAGDVAARPLADGMWQVATMRPGDAPLAALSSALAPWSTDSGESVDVETSPRDWASRLVLGMASQRPAVSVVLVIDQLEELHSAPPDQVVRFGDAVEALAESGRVWIVATIRTDRMTLLDAAPALARLASSDRTFRLDRPTPFELFEMVTQPAAMAGLRFETPASGASLPDRLANLAMQSPDSLPLLQAVLTRLAERATGGVLTEESYDRIGRFEGAISRWADESLVPLRRAGIEEADIDRALAELVRFAPDTGTALAREAVVGGEPSRRAVFDALVAARVASVGKRSDGSSAVRVAHEAMMANWVRLRSLADRLRADLVTRDWLEAAAARWVAGGRVDGDLLGNPQRIGEAQRLLGDRLVAVEGEAEPFVARSEAHYQKVEHAALRLAQAEAERASAELAREAAARRLAEAEAERSAAELARAGAARQLAEAEAEASTAKAAREAAGRQLAENTARTQRLLLAAGTVVMGMLTAAAAALIYIAGVAADQRDSARANESAAVRSLLSAMVSEQRAKEAESRAAGAAAERVRIAALQADALLDANDATGALARMRDVLPDAADDGSGSVPSEALVTLSNILRGYRNVWRVASDAPWRSTSFMADGSLLAMRKDVPIVYRYSTSGDATAAFDIASTPETGQFVRALPVGNNVLTCGERLELHNLASFTVWVVPSALAGACDEFRVAFSQDGTRMLLAARDRLEMVDINGQRMMSAGLSSLPDVIQDIGFAKSDPVVLGNDADTGELRALVGGSKPDVRVFKEFDQTYDWARLAPNGKSLVIVRSKAKTSTMYDIASGRWMGGLDFPGVGLDMSPDGRWLLVEKGIDSSLWSLDLRLTFNTYVQYAQGGKVADFGPDGTLSAAIDDRETLWLIASGWAGDEGIAASSVNSPNTHTVQFSPDGTKIAVSYDGDLSVWDVRPSLALAQYSARYGYINHFLVSDDGSRLLGKDDDGITVWDIPSGRILNRFIADVTVADQLSQNGRYYVSIGPDNTIDIWETSVPRSKPVLQVTADGTQIPFVDISPDGRLVTVVSDDTAPVRHYDLPSGRPDPTPELDKWAPGQQAPGGGRILRSVAWSGKRALLTSDARIVMLDADGREEWQVSTGQFGDPEESPAANDRSRFHLAFAREGTRLLLSGPLSATLYGAATGLTIMTFGATASNPMGNVYGAQISLDGRTLVAGGPGGSAKIVDIETGQVRDQFDGGSYPRLLREGDRVLSIDHGRIRLWPFTDDQRLLATAGAMVDRRVDLPNATQPRSPDGSAVKAGDRTP